MNAQYSWYAMLNLVVSVSLGVLLLVVVTIGWLRYRRAGFLVLIVWALALLSGNALPLFSGLLRPALQKLFPTANQWLFAVLPHFGVSIVTSLLLLTGLALLVFNPPALERKLQRPNA